MPSLLEHAIRVSKASNGRTRFEAPVAASDGDDGISAAERGELADEIDRLFTDRSLIRTDEGRSPPKRRKGVALPIAVNLIAVLIILTAVLVSRNLLSFAPPSRKEAPASFTTTEGLLVARVRAQASAELSARERRIAAIQEELAQLSRSSVGSGGPQLAAASSRERELERELSSLQSSANDRLAALTAAREHDRFLIRQLQGIYQNMQAQISADRLSPALVGVTDADRIVAMIGQGGDPQMASLRAALQAGDDLLRVAVLYGQSTRENAGSSEKLAARIRELEGSVAALQRSLSEQARNLERYRARLESRDATVAEQSRLISAQGRELKQRADELAAVVASLQRGVQDLRERLGVSRAHQSASAQKAEILDLLATKVKVREALSSEAVKSKYPSLPAKLDPFFRQYGEVYARQGRESALKEVSAALGAMASSLDARLFGDADQAPSLAASASSARATDPSPEQGSISAYLAKLDALLDTMLRRLN